MKTAQFVSQILDIGEILLVSGAEVNRVEDTIRRIGSAYGYVKMDVFTITSSIVVTVRSEDGQITTQTRRISGYRTDMELVERANALSRELCEKKPPIETIPERVQQLKIPHRYGETLTTIAYVVAAGVFAIFFGGDLWDCIAAFLPAFLMRRMMCLGERMRLNPLIATFICALTGSIVIVILTRLGIGHSIDYIMIGCVMLMIPGLGLTSSLRDMITGDTMSGLLGLCEAVIKAVVLAVGFALVMIPLGV